METPCLEWDGYRDKGGYGKRYVSLRGQCSVHCLAWEDAHGPIPNGMNVLHKCDNPSCYNVEHLFLGTTLDNVADRVAKGRSDRPQGMKHPQAVLTDGKVKEIRERYGVNGCTQQQLADEFGISRAHVAGILSRRFWSHI